MIFPVTQTQVITPRRRADIVSRPRLLNLLQQQLDRKLLLIVAPAGYGKTSLLIDLAHQIDTALCWYSVDSLDRNLLRFMNHFIAAISRRFPEFGAESTTFLQNLASNQCTIEQLVTILVNELYEKVDEQFILVVDDYHLISDGSISEIDLFISHFVQRAGDSCNLILASRQLLPLPDLPLLVARSLVGGIGLEDLAFQTDEIQTLYTQNHHTNLSDSAALDLVDSTEGWITGLLLSAQLPQQERSLQFRAMRASGVDLYDYLTDQIFNRQEPSIQQFLLYTSLFKEFNAALCQSILGPLWQPPDMSWSQSIETILSRNLFVLPVGNNGEWLRYHHLFQNFLRKRLLREEAEIAQEILKQLFAAFVTERKWEEAYEVCQMLEEAQTTADLIAQAGDTLLHSGQVILIEQWISALPELLVEQRPPLLSLKGIALVAQGKHEPGLTLLNRAESSLRNTPTAELQHAITLIRRSTAHRLLGNYALADEDAGQALHQLDALFEHRVGTNAQTPHAESCAKELPKMEFEHAQAAVRAEKGLSACMRGDLEGGVSWLIKAQEYYEHLGDMQNAAGVINDIAVAHMNAGQYRLAEAEFLRTLNFWQTFNNIFRQAHTLNNLGVLCHQQGSYLQAHQYLTESFQLALRCGYERMMAFSLVSLGDLFADLECIKQAEETYREAREIAHQIEERFLVIYLETAQANLACRSSDWLRAYNHLDHVGQLVLDRHSQYEWGLYRMAMGQFYLYQNKTDRAILLLEEAASAFEEGGQRADAAQTRLMLACAYHQAGKPQAVYTELAQCGKLAERTESQQPIVVAGYYLRSHLAKIMADAEARLIHDMDLDSLPSLESRAKTAESKARPMANAHTAVNALGSLMEKIERFTEQLGPIQQQLLPAEAEQVAASSTPNVEPRAASGSQTASKPPTAAEQSTISIPQTAKLEIRALGRIEINKEGQPIRSSDWKAQSARDLFLCLLAHPNGLTKEEIGLFFWSDSTPAQIKARFKNMVYRLRRAVEQEAVIFDNNLYSFNRHMDYVYDVELFLEYTARARAADSAAEQKKLLQAAIDLYQGDYLPDVDAMWAWLERERLRRIYTEINLALGELCYDAAEYLEAISICQKLFSEDSCMEEAHRLAMRVYAAMGNRAAVVRQYEQCMQSLRQEVDAPPSEQTIDLFETLIA